MPKRIKRGRQEKLNRIKEVLDSKGITQSWLAGELDVEFRTMNRYTTNFRQPSIQTLFKIAEILKVNPKDLLNT